MPLRAKVELVNLQGAIEFESLEAALEHVRLTASANASLANATDITTVYITNNKFFENEFSVSDIDIISIGKSPSDSAAAAESFDAIFGKVLTEQPSVTESLARVMVFNRSHTDQIGVASAEQIEISKPQTDQAAVGDLYTGVFNKSPVEELTAISDFSRNVVYKRVPVESLAISDVYVRQVAYARSFTETVFATDDLDGEATILDDQEIQFFKTRTDAAITSDTFARQVSFNRAFTDSGVAAEGLAIGFGRSLSDTSTFTDSIDSLAVGKGLSDSTAVSEVQQKAIQKGTSDDASATELPSKGVSKPTSDAFDAADSDVISFGKSQTDPVSTADAGSLVSQGYVDNNQYFAEVYVGTSRSF